jgi:hypothetical protein
LFTEIYTFFTKIIAPTAKYQYGSPPDYYTETRRDFSRTRMTRAPDLAEKWAKIKKMKKNKKKVTNSSRSSVYIVCDGILEPKNSEKKIEPFL